MCLVLYPDTISRVLHDSIMSTLESPVGQEATEFADALFRAVSADGRNTLEVCHKEGFIKKVQTSQVIVTPTATSNVRLDELNKILDEMALGEDAVKRMADLDKNQGLVGPKNRNVETKTTSAGIAGAVEGTSDSTGVLTDSAIAKQQLSQAEKMKTDAANLLLEAARLEKEALTLDPTLIQNASQETIAA